MRLRQGLNRLSSRFRECVTHLSRGSERPDGKGPARASQCHQWRLGLIAGLKAGITERMRVTPASRMALLLGRPLRDVAMLILQATLIVVAAPPFGLTLHLPGVLLAFVLMAVIALLMASISYAAALRLRDEGTFGAIVFSATLPVMLPISLAPAWQEAVTDFTIPCCMRWMRSELYSPTMLHTSAPSRDLRRSASWQFYDRDGGAIVWTGGRVS